MTDDKPNSMTDRESDTLPPAQARTLEMVQIQWRDIPQIGVHGMLVSALKDRRLIETRWRTPGVRQWRRVP